MAADVVTPMDRGLEPQRKPFRAEKRASSRRAAFIAKFSRARNSRDRFDYAVDYFRSTTADHRIDQAKAAVALEQLARTLIEQADQLTQTLRRNR